MTRLILACVAVAGIFLGVVPTVAAAAPEGSFSLVDPKPRLVAGEPLQGELERAFIVGKADLAGAPNGNVISLIGEIKDVTSEDDRSEASGTARLSVVASVDPAIGTVTGTYSATLAYEMRSESVSQTGPMLKFINHYVGTYTWMGKVTGTVGPAKAELVYSGDRTTVRCTVTTQKVNASGKLEAPYPADPCVFPPIPEKWTVDYTVAGAPAATAIGGDGAEGRGQVSGVTGWVSYSPADQADLEPGARTWILIKPGEKILVQDGVTLRTGRDGGIKLIYASGALVRLHPSTMLTMKPPAAPTFTLRVGLIEGFIDLFMGALNKNKNKNKLEIKPGYWVETDTANTSIKGTTFRVAITDGATVVTTTEGVVTVTARATNQTVDVGAGQAATVDGKGITTGPADPADLLNPANPDADTASAVGGSGLPIVPIAGAAILAVVIGAVALFAVRRGKRRREQ